MKLQYSFVSAAVCGMLLLPCAHADTVTLTLTPSLQAGAPGSTVTYSAILSAPNTNGALVYLNDDTITLNDPAGVATDGSDLLFDFPADLVPGQVASGALFTVMLPSAAAAGTYSGFFILEGGANSSAESTLSKTPFTLSVTPAASVTPEPSSWLLLGTGLLGLAGAARRRLG